MRFAATHKTVSYLMVSTALLMLVLAGEIPVLLALASTALIIASYFFEPATHPWLVHKRFIWTLYGVALFSCVLLLPIDRASDAWWDTATQILVVLLVVKLWRRRSNGDYLHAYLLSFVMLGISCLVGASILYALGLLLYAIFATWTLTLFHLRREMEENYLLKHLPGRHGQAAESERVEVERILNSRRVIGTPFLALTSVLAFALFLVGGLVFVLLPRLGIGLELPLRRRPLLLTGFSEQIQLGTHGLLRENNRIVMRVEVKGDKDAAPPASATALRFRGMAFEHYAKGQWQRTAQGPAVERPVRLSDGVYLLASPSTERLQRPDTLRAEVYLDPMDTSVLFTPSPAHIQAVSMPSAWSMASQWPLTVDASDDLWARNRPGGLHYTVYFQPGAATGYPAGDGAVVGVQPALAMGSERKESLQVPAEILPRLRALAEGLTRGQTDPIQKAQILAQYLRSQFTYTTHLTQLSADEQRRFSDPIEAFLFERKRGHCEYFASALTLLLRSINIKSRIVNGYLGGEYNRYGKYLVVRQQHAHSWVEALLPVGGVEGVPTWMILDPTPASGQRQPESGTWPTLRALSDTLEMSWQKYVLEYDPTAQRWLSRQLRARLPQLELRAATGRPGLWAWLLLALVSGGLLWGLRGLLRTLWTTRMAKLLPFFTSLATQSHLHQALQQLRDRGFSLRPGETLYMLSERITEAGDPIGAPFQALVVAHYAHRFGGLPLDVSALDALLSQMAQTTPQSRM